MDIQGNNTRDQEKESTHHEDYKDVERAVYKGAFKANLMTVGTVSAVVGGVYGVYRVTRWAFKTVSDLGLLPGK